MMSHAELRLIENGQESGTIRVSDILAVVPAITGKVELVYEGENEGPVFVAEHLIEHAIKQIFEDYFPKIEKLEKKGVETPYDQLYTWFYENDALELHDNADDTYYRQCLDQIKPLEQLLNKYAPEAEGDLKYFFKELVIFGLVASQKLAKGRFENTTMINDLYSSYFS
jgi:magnesium chelatase subunit I